MTAKQYIIDLTVHPQYSPLFTSNRIISAESFSEHTEYAVVSNYDKDNSLFIVSLHDDELSALRSLREYRNKVDANVKECWRTPHLKNSQIWLQAFRNFRVEVVRVVPQETVGFLS